MSHTEVAMRWLQAGGMCGGGAKRRQVVPPPALAPSRARRGADGQRQTEGGKEAQPWLKVQ